MRIIPVLMLLGLTSTVCAIDYYVSSSGDDINNSGLSESSPWKTIGKVNSVFPSLNPGDKILFKRGDTFYGTIIVTKSGTAAARIVIGSYGSGEKPVITGFKNLTDWSDEGNGIYSAPLSSEALTNMVTVNGNQIAMGRFPDAGSNLVFESFKSSPLSITDTGLGDAVNWTGAEAVINVNDWSLDRCRISSHSGDVLIYSNLGSGAVPTNSGRYYFIQNNIKCLSTDNEWFHSFSDSRFYIFSNPSDKTIKVSCLNYLISNNSYDYITIDGLNLTGAILFAIHMPNGSTYCTVQNCTVSNIGESGIRCDNASYHLYDNNFMTDINRSAIYCNNSGYFRITNNTIKNTGIIPGGSFRATQNDGLYLYSCNNSVVQYNSITNTGYNGIYITGSKTEIINNYINFPCILLNDGGGIYTSGGGYTGRVFSGNIILNSGAGNVNATLAEGIYLDEYSANVTVNNNTIANSKFAGIKNHKGYNNIITSNTIFNNGTGIFLQNSSVASGAIHDLNINKNIIVASDKAQIALRFYSLADDLPVFGTADYNYYARPVDDDDIIYTYSPSTGSKYRQVSDWQSFTKQDLHSRKSPVLISDTSKISFYYNTNKSQKIIVLTTPMIDITGVKYSGSITLQPYTSIVLFPDPNPLNPTAPVVSINSSSKGNTFVAPATLVIEVQASDPDGTITKVELFNGNEKISEMTQGPFTFTLKDIPEGSYYLTAVATDNMKSSSTSAVLEFQVTRYNENSEFFNLYPNPNNGNFSINFTNPLINGNYSIEVINLSGRTVYQGIISPESVNSIFDLSHLSPGTYVVIFKNNLILATQKFIKV